MVDSVGFGSSVNSALQGVQRTSQQSNQTNEQLSTGQKINDPLDGAEDFFAALALTNRAADLAQVKDQVGQAISMIQAANVGLEAINDLSGQARAIAQQAQNTNDPTERARLADQFNQIRVQIDSIATDSGISGNNLIGSAPDTLEVSLNEEAASLLSLQTRQALGANVLTIATDNERAVLGLFG